jgi:hypothetical protein
MLKLSTIKSFAARGAVVIGEHANDSMGDDDVFPDDIVRPCARQ